jgi:hypothetical protein
MNISRYLYVSLIIFLLSFNIVLIIKNAKIKIECNSFISKTNEFDQYYKLFRFREAETLLNNDTKLDFNLLIIDDNNTSVKLTQLLAKNKDSHKLIIRHSALACDVCLSEELKLIDDYISEIGKNNVIILASDYNARALKVLKQTILLDVPIYRVENMGIPFEEKHNNLFIFSVNKELIVKDFFIPEKTMPELSRSYYKTICDKY